jgi:hypothetical protein
LKCQRNARTGSLTVLGVDDGNISSREVEKLRRKEMRKRGTPSHPEPVEGVDRNPDLPQRKAVYLGSCRDGFVWVYHLSGVQAPC